MISPTSLSIHKSSALSEDIDLIHDESNSTKSNKFYLNVAKQILNAAIPTIFCLELTLGSHFINVYMIGNINDPILLGSLGVAYVWLNCISYTIFMSLSTGLISLAASSYGKKDFKLTGLYFQRGCLINFCFFVMSFVIILFSRYFLIFFGMDIVIVNYALDYIYYSIPSIFFFSFYDLAKNFLQVHGIFNPQLIIQIISIFFHLILAHFFIQKWEMKLRGAALARNLSDLFLFLSIYLYIYIQKPLKETWIPWSKEALKGWNKYISVSLTIALSVYLESLCYELMTILAGNLPHKEHLAAHVAMASISTLFFNMSFGLSIVMQNFISNLMGKAKPNTARIFAKIGLIINTAMCVVFFLLVWNFRESLSILYTKENNVVAVLINLVEIYAFLSAADFTGIFTSGILKGIGKERLLLKLYIFFYYIIGIPFSFALAFFADWGVYGLWSGWTAGLYITMIGFLFVYYKTDWNFQCSEIRDRLLQEQNKEEYEMETLD